MSVRSGTHQLGPAQATLQVHTKRGGAAAKAGHDLVIEVGAWQATLTVGEEAADSSVELGADSASLRVTEGSGGMQALGDEDRANIEQTINDEVLEGREISFRSTSAEPTEGGIRLEGELAIGDASRPIGFDLAVGEGGEIGARAVVKQSDWGIEPYTALFGALKVEDELAVVLDGHLPDPQSR
jgi:polyisoprenoid-binding protein YceI